VTSDFYCLVRFSRFGRVSRVRVGITLKLGLQIMVWMLIPKFRTDGKNGFITLTYPYCVHSHVKKTTMKQ